jgi:hypothetical protein
MKEITEKIFQLLEEAANGELSKEKQQLLKELADKEPEAYARAQQLMQLDHDLKTLQPAKKSEDLQELVLQSIASKQNADHDAARTPLKATYMQRIYFIAAVAAGVFLGLVAGKVLFTNQAEISTSNLSGTMISGEKQTVSYAAANSSIKMIPYKVDSYWYLNFIIDTQDEILASITFNDQDLTLVKATYIYTNKGEQMEMNTGNFQFSAQGRVSFQAIMEMKENPSSKIELKISRNQSILIEKEIFLE